MNDPIATSDTSETSKLSNFANFVTNFSSSTNGGRMSMGSENPLGENTYDSFYWFFKMANDSIGQETLLSVAGQT